MRSQRVEALEEIEADLRDARLYYDSWRSDGSGYFKKHFDETVAWIEWNPEVFPRKYRIFRRAIIRNTYFAIFYAIEADVTTIVAVVDMRRRPRTIRGLLTARGR